MKQVGFALAIAAVSILGTLGAVSANDDRAPKKGMVIGDVIEVSTFTMQGHGEEHVAATKSRVDQGFPVAILEDETGDVYFAFYKNPAPASGLEKGNSHLSDLVGKKVVTQGLIYKAGGLNSIRMSLVSEY